MLYKLVALLSLPLLVFQGKQVRKRALKLPEAMGERNGSSEISSNHPLSILIIGDSSAAGVGVSDQQSALLGQLVSILEQQFNLSWRLLAKTGAKTQDLIPMLQNEKLANTYDIIITSLGVNDVTSLQRTKHWLNEQNKLHQYCFDTLKAKHIIINGMPPMHRFPLLPQPLRWVIGSRAKAFDRLQAKQISQFSNKSYEPVAFELDESAMASDGFHPGELIYKEWGLSLSERINVIAKDLLNS
jgi:lysophospholipase L1-like esterase